MSGRAFRAAFDTSKEAAVRGLHEVDTEHFLLALIRDRESGAARLLEALGISLDRLRAEIEPHMVRGAPIPN